MRKSIPMLDNTKHLRGGRRPPRSLIGMSFRPGIPWQVALQQSLPPLSQPPPFCKTNGVPVEQFSAGGSCLTLVVSQKGPQSTSRLLPQTVSSRVRHLPEAPATLRSRSLHQFLRAPKHVQEHFFRQL